MKTKARSSARAAALSLTLLAAGALLGLPGAARAQTEGGGPPEASAESAELGALRARVERLEAALAERLAADQQAEDERIEELTDQVEDLQADLEDLQTQAEETSDALASRLDRQTRVFGYTTSFLRLREGGSLDFRGFRVNMMLDARMDANMRFFAEIEFEDGAEIGSSEDESGVIEVERGFFELTFDEAIGARAGILLSSFGRFNLDHQGWRFPFSERPILYDRIFPSTFADVGVELFGTLVNDEDFALRYRLGTANGLREGIGRLRDGAVDFSKGLRGARPIFHNDNNDAKSVVGRLELSFGEHVDIGASGYWDIYTDDDTTALGLGGLDVWLRWTDLTIRAEGALGYIGESTVSFATQDPMGMATTVSSRTPSWISGAYLEVEGRFMPDAWHESALGRFGPPGTARFFLAGRLEYARIDLRDPIVRTGMPDQTALDELRISGSIGYRPIVESSIRLELLYGAGQGIILSDSWMAKLSFALGY